MFRDDDRLDYIKMVNEGKTYAKKILKRKSRQDSWYLTGRTKYLMFFLCLINIIHI